MGITEREALAEHLASYEEGYDTGWREGYATGYSRAEARYAEAEPRISQFPARVPGPRMRRGVPRSKFPRQPGNPHPKKRKLSAWNKFVKANSKKPRFKYKNGKLNLKKMGVAFRKTPAGKKKK